MSQSNPSFQAHNPVQGDAGESVPLIPHGHDEHRPVANTFFWLACTLTAAALVMQVYLLLCLDLPWSR